MSNDPEVPSNTPKWTSTNISIGNLVDLIKEGEYNLDPEHQRDIVHTYKWREDLIDSIFQTGCIPPTFWHPNCTDEHISFDSVDGKQRCNTFLEFLSNTDTWKWKGKKYNQLSEQLKRRIRNFEVTVIKSNRTLTQDELRNTFNRFQITKKTTMGEILNADICSLRTMLIDTLKEDAELYEGVFMKDTRKHVFEIYAKLFIYFAYRKTKLTNDKIHKLWGKSRECRESIDGNKIMYRTCITYMWQVLTSPTNTNIMRRDTKIIPLFCALAFVNCDQRLELFDLLKINYHNYVLQWSGIDGNHDGHLIRYTMLKQNLPPQFQFSV